MGMVSAINDLAFKKALGSVENVDILSGFITDFFGIIPTEIVIENPYSIDVFKKSIQGEEMPELRETLKDISALIKIGSAANFTAELQVRKKIFYDERSVYYAFDKFCKNYNSEGQMRLDSEKKPIRYSSLKPVYALNILGYVQFHGGY
ncbi:PD-(D/E)XK nuclease family transposase [Breznakiellaceae bacterium SP9]